MGLSKMNTEISNKRYSLTPTLSRWERGNHSPVHCDVVSWRLRLALLM